jgi:BMFP domain-containing protein YqiC
MIGRLPVDEILTRFAGLLPEGTELLREDLKKNLRSAVEATLFRMDLVTREEFDVQTALLSRTRARLEAMEKQIAALEEALRGRPAGPS